MVPAITVSSSRASRGVSAGGGDLLVDERLDVLLVDVALAGRRAP